VLGLALISWQVNLAVDAVRATKTATQTANRLAAAPAAFDSMDTAIELCDEMLDIDQELALYSVKALAIRRWLTATLMGLKA
jgi:hypothetical protein